MNLEARQVRELLGRDLTGILILVGIIVAMIWFSVQALMPFVGLTLWGSILAVTPYPPHHKVPARLGNRQGRQRCGWSGRC